jgi:hypothetical protein
MYAYVTRIANMFKFAKRLRHVKSSRSFHSETHLRVCSLDHRFGIDNSYVGIGIYEASDSPFSGVAGNQPTLGRLNREINMWRHRVVSVRRYTVLQDATSALIISTAKQRAFVFQLVRPVKCYIWNKLLINQVVKCLESQVIYHSTSNNHPFARGKESSAPAGLTS